MRAHFYFLFVLLCLVFLLIFFGGVVATAECRCVCGGGVGGWEEDRDQDVPCEICKEARKVGNKQTYIWRAGESG